MSDHPLRNYSSKPLWAITIGPVGHVAYRLGPGLQSPGGVVVKAVRTIDGSRIDAHDGWWTIFDGHAADIRGTDPVLVLDCDLCRRQPSNRFSNVQYEQHVDWGVPISGSDVRVVRYGVVSGGQPNSDDATLLAETSPGTPESSRPRLIAVQERVPHFGPVTAVSVPYHASWVVSGSQAGSLFVHWLRGPTAYMRAYANSKVAFLNRAITALGTSTCGRYAVSACEDGTVRLWDVLESFRGEPNTINPRLIEAVQFPVQGTVVRSAVWWTNNFGVDWLLTGGDDGTVRILRVKTQEEEVRFNHESPVSQVHWGPEGRSIITVGGGVCRFWSTRTGEELTAYRFQPDHGIECLIPLFAWDNVWVSYADTDHNVLLRSLLGGDHYTYTRHDGKVTAIGFTADEASVVSASEDGTVRAFDVATQRQVFRFTNESPVLSALTFARGDLSYSDTDYIITGAADGLWRAWTWTDNSNGSKSLYKPSALGYGQLSNKTGETLLVYGPKLGGSFDNSLYHLPTGRKTPDNWDCDGFFIPNDRFADQAASTDQGPLAIKYVDFRTPVIERSGVNYRCSLNNGAYRSGEINWEIPNISYAAVPGVYPVVPGHVPA